MKKFSIKLLIAILIIQNCALLALTGNPTYPPTSSLLSITSISSPTTISTPGHYVVTASFEVSSGDGITINANDVVLDLAYNVINGTGGDNGIVVNSGKSNAIIRNGTVRNMTGYGLLIQGDQCSVDNCDFVSNSTGVSVNSANQADIKQCTSSSNTSTGFLLSSSNNSNLHQCRAINNGGSASAYGFYTSGGSYNRFESCLAQGTTTTSTSQSDIASGFFFASDEVASSIVNCVSENTTTPSNGSSRAYGIALEQTFSGQATELTEQTPSQSVLTSLAWTADGAYLAIGAGTGGYPPVVISKFNGKMLLPVASGLSSGDVNAVDWTQDTKFLAVGGNTNGFAPNSTTIYEFEENQNCGSSALTFVTTSTHSDLVHSVHWHSDGKSLAVGDDNGNIRIYKFDDARLTFQTSAVHDAPVRTVRWSQNGNYLAIGGDEGAAFDVRIYSYNGTTLTEVTDYSHGAPVRGIDWSPDGTKLVMVGDSSSSITIRVHSFDGSTLTQLDSADHGASVNGVHWSPDGNFIVIGGAQDANNFDTKIYSVSSGGTLTLTSLLIHGNTINSVAWAPNEKYIAECGDFGFQDFVQGNFFENVRVWQSTLGGPNKCTIKDNEVSLTSGNHGTAIGINADSLQNLVLGNTAYGNDRNYLFTTNIYTSGLQGSPTSLENISLPPL